MRRRPDGTHVMVTEASVRNPDGSVTTTTTEQDVGGIFGGQSTTTTTTTTRPGAGGASSSSPHRQAPPGGLMTGFVTRLLGQAVAGFLISFIPKLIGWVLRFLLVGGRRR